MIAKLLALLLALNPHCGVNSRSEDYSRSKLNMIRSTEVVLGADELGLKTKPAYPRIRRMANGEYILAWQHVIPGRSDDNGQDTYYAISKDLHHWTPMGPLFESRKVRNVYGNESTRWYTCPEFLVLSNGNVLAVNSFWNISTYSRIEGRPDHGLSVKCSSDNGRTWSDEIEIFHGQCWEPFLMEMPDGQIHCYFTEARSWISSGNSGTSLVISDDGGMTWTPGLGERAYRVMRKRYWNPNMERWQYTDQMPTGVVLNGSRKMAFAMEDYDMGKYSLGIVYSPDDGKWDYLQGVQIGPKERLDSVAVNATGPYIGQFPSGETLVIFTRNKGIQWPLLYKIGSPRADDFGPEYRAFERGGWAGMDIDSPHTAVMVAPFVGGGSLHVARFALNHSLEASQKGSGQAQDSLILSCSASEEVSIKCCVDRENVYFCINASEGLPSKLDLEIYRPDLSDSLTVSHNFANGERYAEVSLPKSRINSDRIIFNARLYGRDRVDCISEVGRDGIYIYGLKQ